MSHKQASPLDRSRVRSPTRTATAALAVMALGGGVAAWSAVSARADHARREATAIAARTIAMRETVHTTNVSHQGYTVINDRGRGTGTFPCAAVMQVVVHYTKGTAKFTCSISSGSVTADGTTSFFTAGQTATFTGTMTVTHGTGKFSHASGKMNVEGTWQRKTLVLQAVVSGTIRY